MNFKNVVRLGVSGFAIATLALTATPAFAARELGSGGGPVGTGGGATVCSPISSLTMKADPRVGELGFASLDMNYSVKPCDKTQTVRIVVEVIESRTGEVIYQDTDAVASGKFTLPGIKVRTSYTGRVTVLDATTGEVLGVRSAGVAAIPKGV